MNENTRQAIIDLLTMTDAQLEARLQFAEIVRQQELEFEFDLEDANDTANARNQRDKKAWKRLRKEG